MKRCTKNLYQEPQGLSINISTMNIYDEHLLEGKPRQVAAGIDHSPPSQWQLCVSGIPCREILKIPEDGQPSPGLSVVCDGFYSLRQLWPQTV